jgi:glycosyltransferase involved in cell wall biosynthesis
MRPHLARRPRPDDAPLAFLVSTTRPAVAGAAASHLGANAYSYAHVLDLLAPILNRLGTVHQVEHPETSLAFAARRAVARGYRPVHLALVPPQEACFTPGVPTVLLPFWEFPRIPDRDFGHDTRQNWARIARGAAAILCASPFTADAFRRAGVTCPVAVVPVPVSRDAFETPAWDPSWTWTHTCRHLDLRPEPIATACPTESEPTPPPPAPRRGHLYRAAWRTYLWLYPRLKPETTARLIRAQRWLRRAVKENPSRLLYRAARAGYRKTIKRLLSPQAAAGLRAFKNRTLARLGMERAVPPPPLLPSSPLSLSGLVYTSILNLRDPRKNWGDGLSAFLHAFRERPDATLVLKLVTNPAREHADLSLFLDHYHALRIGHRCRVVVIGEYLDDAALSGLVRASTYYVNTSHAEGACLPLREALAAGRPAIAPAHTALADVMDDTVGLVVRAHPEPAAWPHDPSGRPETEQFRLVWQSLLDAFRESAAIADRDRPRHDALAAAARERMREHAHPDRVADALAAALARLAVVTARPAGSPSS